MISELPVGFSNWYTSVSDQAFLQIIQAQQQCLVLRVLPLFLFDSMIAFSFGESLYNGMAFELVSPVHS